jgi:hypothetical protein
MKNNEMFHVEHGRDKDMTITAGVKAIEEIRVAVSELLELLNDRADTTEVCDTLDRILGRFEGSYYYNGWNGWKQALRQPDEKPFDPADWV